MVSHRIRARGEKMETSMSTRMWAFRAWVWAKVKYKSPTIMNSVTSVVPWMGRLNKYRPKTSPVTKSIMADKITPPATLFKNFSSLTMKTPLGLLFPFILLVKLFIFVDNLYAIHAHGAHFLCVIIDQEGGCFFPCIQVEPGIEDQGVGNGGVSQEFAIIVELVGKVDIKIPHGSVYNPSG